MGPLKGNKKGSSIRYNHVLKIYLVKLENTENDNVEMIEIEEHSPEMMNMSNQAQNFETSGNQIAHFSGDGQIYFFDISMISLFSHHEIFSFLLVS